MARMDVQATKSNLMRLEEELDFAKTGHQLLEEKREILLMRIHERIDDLLQRQKELYEEMKKAYRSLAKAILSLGWRRVESIHVRPEGDLDVKVEHKHYMGIDLPYFSLSEISSKPRYSPEGTNALLDEAQRDFVSILPLLVEYAELETQVITLSQALKKTMKRVNALENIFIPDYEDTVSYLCETLEELEREEMYIKKLVKAKK